MGRAIYINGVKAGGGGGGSSTGGGHTIVNDAGTSLDQEDNLQFSGVYAYDDSGNEQTVVAISRQMTRAQFDLLSAAEKKGLIQIMDEVEPDDSYFYPVIYSETEREIGCWTDGKPLYQKTYVIVPTQAETTIDISSLSVDKLVKRSGTFTRNNNGSIQQKNVEYRTEMPSYNNYGIMCEIRDTNLFTKILEYAYSEITEIRITLYYTKTIDTAGSGKWTPQGVPALHYSTDEHVIGTWFGETLYEKSYEVSALPSSSGYMDVLSGLSNVLIKRMFGDCYFSTGEVRPMGYVAKNDSGADVSSAEMTMQLQPNGNIRIFVGQDRHTVSAVITLQYTKSAS